MQMNTQTYTQMNTNADEHTNIYTDEHTLIHLLYAQYIIYVYEYVYIQAWLMPVHTQI